MPDLNSDALGIWEHLKPAIDKEIEQKTRGMVQRRKMKVTTAPSISTGTIGVTEAFGTTEMVIPFATNLISATVGDMVWVEFMYGATNAFASMFASADEKDWDVAGDLSVGGNAGISGNLGVSGSTSLQNTTVNGVLDVTPRRCYASLSQAGWYRVMTISSNISDWSFAVDFCVARSYANTDNEVHTVKMLLTYGTAPLFVNEDSKSNNLNVTAIRYTVNSNGVGYVDIRYDANSANTVAVDFTVHTVPSQQQYFTAESLQSVANSPSGETVLTVYTFAGVTGMRVVHAQSSSSFGDAIATINDIIGDYDITWGGNAANNLHAGISNFSNGVVSVGSSGGPQFFAMLGKLNDSYYAAELFTYNYPWRIRVRNVNGTYHAELYYPNY